MTAFQGAAAAINYVRIYTIPATTDTAITTPTQVTTSPVHSIKTAIQTQEIVSQGASHRMAHVGLLPPFATINMRIYLPTPNTITKILSTILHVYRLPEVVSLGAVRLQGIVQIHLPVATLSTQITVLTLVTTSLVTLQQ